MKGWAEISELSRDTDLFEIASAVQSDHAKEAFVSWSTPFWSRVRWTVYRFPRLDFHNVMPRRAPRSPNPKQSCSGRFSKNVVVNFDPDTAGARATERTLGLLSRRRIQH